MTNSKLLEHDAHTYAIRLERALNQFSEDSKSLYEKVEQNFSSFKDAIFEQTRLQAPVKLWAKVAKKHEIAYRWRMIFSFFQGVIGTFLVFPVSENSYHFAKRLFSDAIINGNLPSSSGLRATWLHELVLAGSATIIYLTLFLWSMRISVRMMLSDHHLSVDARAREAMAETYLGLIAEHGAADEKDRAIVLASLFRPVTDGLVKDDALPMITPASIISGKLAGN